MILEPNTRLKVRATLWVMLLVGLVISSTLSTTQYVSADGDLVLDDATSLEFFINEIYNYNPDETNTFCPPGGVDSEGEVIGSTSSGGAYSTLKEVVRKYGEYAMQLQITYGSPWEVIFAQMQKESGTGTCSSDDCIAKKVKEAGYYNWLGIKGSGDGGTYTDSGGTGWAMYNSVESMMNAWAGPKVLRNGNYEAAFQFTDPDNYDLGAFVKTMLYKYAPPSENNTDLYISQVMALIDGPIKEVRDEMGWPSSAEYAKQEGIRIGGTAGSNSSDIPVDSNNLTAACGPETGNLASYVLAYAWPDYHKANYLTTMPDYAKAVKRRKKAGKYVGGSESYPGIDCGGFVTTLLQESGFDPNYGGGGYVPIQYNYVISNNWKKIDDISDLQPGDVAFKSDNSHTFVYVGNIDGFNSNIASASYGGSSSTPNWRAPMAGKESLTNVTWYRKP